MDFVYEIDMESWLEVTGWATRDQDIDAMIPLYHEWLMISPRIGTDRALDTDLLIRRTLQRMKSIHGESFDAYAVTALLILEMSKLARLEGVYAPKLTSLIQ